MVGHLEDAQGSSGEGGGGGGEDAVGVDDDHGAHEIVAAHPEGGYGAHVVEERHRPGNAVSKGGRETETEVGERQKEMGKW